MKSFAASIIAFLAASASAHVELQNPAPIRSQFNPNTPQGSADFNLKSPLAESGANFPCHGYHKDFDSPAGASVATWAQGSTQKITLKGGATHNGGSCQFSFSYDKGATWVAFHSIQGNCPSSASEFHEISIPIPADAPTGKALFAWSWNNHSGNREFYMNCAAITIGGNAKAKRQSTMAFSSLPNMFVANLQSPGGSCKVREGVDVQYPAPGPNPVSQGNSLGKPDGDCGSAAAQPAPGTGNGNGNGNGNGAPAPTSSKAAVPTSKGGIFAPVPTFQTQTVAPPATTSAAAEILPIKEGAGNVLAPAVPEPTTTSAAPVAPKPSANPAVPQPGTGNGGSASNPGNIQAPAQAVGTACTSEGIWNCISGTSFQRCASGQWSQVMQLAAGMECTAGESETISMKASNSRVRRYSPGRRVRWA